MKSIKRGIASVMAILTSFCFYGCNKTSTMDFTCFNTGVHVEVSGKTLSNELQINIKDALYSLEEQFSVKDGSFTKSFNDCKIGESLQVDTQTVQLLETVKYLYEFTDKKFNPAV
ncbi:MAG: FAD:protein FMN transferase [Clostridia bacterium]|nr:FAD:protein FMN transferase [Clostridia bacterium]